MGIVLSNKGRYVDALTNFEIALKVKIELQGEEKIQAADIYQYMGEANEKLNKPEEAVNYYIKSVEALKKSDGELQKPLADQYLRIAEVLRKEGKAQESKEYQDKAQKIYEHLSPKKEAQAGKSKDDTPVRPEKQESSILELKKEIEKISKSKKKEDLAKLAKLQEDIGNVYFKKDRYKEARESFEKSQKSWVKALGDKCLEAALVYNSIAEALLGEERTEDALKVAEKGLAILVKIAGPEDPNVADFKMTLGKILEQMEETGQALANFKQAYELRKKVLGEEARETKMSERAIKQLTNS